MAPADRILDFNIPENVAGGRGRNTAVSVLEPVMRIERDKDGRYRIVATFNVQVKIHAFERGYMNTHNKMFDFISLRYLYCRGEEHEVKPYGDRLAKGIKVSSEITDSKSFQAGITSDAQMGSVSPSATVHVQRDNKLTIERETKSWRKGLTYESHKWKRRTSEFAGWRGDRCVGSSHHRHYFQVQSLHKPGCKCPILGNVSGPFCPLMERNYYDRCAHWFWQTEAQGHLWTPEIYESMTFSVTVIRIVKAKELEAKRSLKEIMPYLHFDFVLKTRLRELGWKLTDAFKLSCSKKPAEIRTKSDFGYPIATERVAFCVWCCPEWIHWPEGPTRILNREGQNEVDNRGQRARRLPTHEEYIDREEKESSERREREERALLQQKEKDLVEKVVQKLQENKDKEKIQNLSSEIHMMKERLKERSERDSSVLRGRYNTPCTCCCYDVYEECRYCRPRHERSHGRHPSVHCYREHYWSDSDLDSLATRREIPQRRNRWRSSYGSRGRGEFTMSGANGMPDDADAGASINVGQSRGRSRQRHFSSSSDLDGYSSDREWEIPPHRMRRFGYFMRHEPACRHHESHHTKAKASGNHEWKDQSRGGLAKPDREIVEKEKERKDIKLRARERQEQDARGQKASKKGRREKSELERDSSAAQPTERRRVFKDGEGFEWVNNGVELMDHEKLDGDAHSRRDHTGHWRRDRYHEHRRRHRHGHRGANT